MYVRKMIMASRSACRACRAGGAGGSSRVLPFALRSRTRLFHSSAAKNAYSDTLNNLKINEHTRVVYQGFTGKQATANAIQSIEWGTNVVGGVTPGKSGEHIGLPLLPTMKEAVRELKPDATSVFVAAPYAAKAIEESIEVEVPLIVAVAEHIPVHEMLRVHSILKTQSRTRLVGANCPGMINPITRTRIGFFPHTVVSPGTVGIVAKSGTLSYEAAASLTRAGLGQSLVLGVGGDWLAGTSLLDGVKLLLEDPDTEGIVIIGEVGGNAELHVCDYLRSLGSNRRKPVMGLVAGVTAVKDRTMGHAGAIHGVGERDARDKILLLKDAGVEQVLHPGQFGKGMLRLLRSGAGGERGGLNGHRREAKLGRFLGQQTRSLHLVASQADRRNQDLLAKMLKENGNIHVLSGYPELEEAQCTLDLGITIDRTALCPTIFVSPSDLEKAKWERVFFPFDYRPEGPSEAIIKQLLDRLDIVYNSQHSPVLRRDVPELIRMLWRTFVQREAYTIHLKRVSIFPDTDRRLHFCLAAWSEIYLHLDDAAYNSSGRQSDLAALRNPTPEEARAAAAGIVYIKLPDVDANIGTLVNGAGLAMNTNDVLKAKGGKPTNFLDTGGKATSETVRESLGLIVQDPRVKVIFVNIFGGLTRGKIIAEGVVTGFKELGIQLPVVVRIRGTEEEDARKVISESGLPLYAFDDLDEAAAKVIELAEQA